MHIRAVCTFTDWTAFAGCWGEAGVCRVFEELRIAGVRDVYWRVFNGGLAMYPSHVAEIQTPAVYDAWLEGNCYPYSNRPVHYLREIDFSGFDPIAAAVDVAAEFGIRLHLWWSLYEDEHSRPFRNRFNAEHSEYWHTDREGRAYSGTFDWFYDEVREHKLAIADELAQYPVAGLLLDFVRHNATPSADRNGVHRFGYNREIRDAFREAHGADPLALPADDDAWLMFKRDIRTSLVREIRERMDAAETNRELSLMLWPVDYSRWCCLDVPALTGHGAVQMLTAMSLSYSVRPDEAVHHHSVLRAQSQSDEVDILPGIAAYSGLEACHLDSFVEAAEEAGASGVMLYEADALTKFGLATAVRAVNLGTPNYKRRLTASRVPAVSAVADWQAVPAFTGFLFHFGPSPEQTPSEQTSVSIVYDDESLLVRFVCSEGDISAAVAPVEDHPQHQYYLDALAQRGPYYDQNSFSLLLDPEHSHVEFFQFGITPRGEKTESTFIDETWSGQWDGSVEVEAGAWSGAIRVAFAELGLTAPAPGDVWGINLLRGVRAAGEIDIWFPIAGQRPCPHELGHLVFG